MGVRVIPIWTMSWARPMRCRILNIEPIQVVFCEAYFRLLVGLAFEVQARQRPIGQSGQGHERRALPLPGIRRVFHVFAYRSLNVGSFPRLAFYSLCF
jgi:hypothetical protein